MFEASTVSRPPGAQVGDVLDKVGKPFGFPSVPNVFQWFSIFYAGLTEFSHSRRFGAHCMLKSNNYSKVEQFGKPSVKIRKQLDKVEKLKAYQLFEEYCPRGHLMTSEPRRP